MPAARQQSFAQVLKQSAMGEILGVAGTSDDCTQGLTANRKGAPTNLREFYEDVMQRKHDDHDASHSNVVNQFLHLISSAMFLWCYVNVWFEPTGAMVAGLLSLIIRQGGHAIWEPPCHDREAMTIGFNTRSKLCVLGCFALTPLLVSLVTGCGFQYGSGLLAPLAKAWLALTAFVVLGHTCALWALLGFPIGMCWLVKFVTDPFTDFPAFYPAFWKIWTTNDWKAGSVATLMGHINKGKVGEQLKQESSGCSLSACLSHAWMLCSLVPLVIIRIIAGYSIVMFALTIRVCCRLIVPSAFRRKHVNRRILMVTDYMPPQMHGIAVRCHNYVEHLRAQGDEVVVFTTDKCEDQTKSFDYPTLPYIINPFNKGNRLAFAPGIELSWNLAMHSWDCVHVVYPSLLSLFVLPVCAIRGIPVYCSHHVDLDYFAHRYVTGWVARAGNFLYNLFAISPATYLASANAAPTMAFLRQHTPGTAGKRQFRIPSGVEDCMCPPQSAEARASERSALMKRAGIVDTSTKIFVMAQRLAPEKSTDMALDAIANMTVDGEKVHLVLAGDGPSMQQLRASAEARDLPVTFLGSVAHSDLPSLYRAADAFVSCSRSETFGLTVMEAMACGTPAVMPHHAVFDELWADKVPSSWRFVHTEGVGALINSMKAAAASREYLTQHPLGLSWRDATAELSKQYQILIDENRRR
eukprot:TRINITY_DN3802_c1_g1_i1.p1 TRINITY_DN3802_c1_g1~~TRINITY_DN3802_c1_g1_i1.p1  ORF type:complete len:712 (+),score=90.89 TRINITY_DN3802_c1_g1_i1:57-2138(+)